MKIQNILPIAFSLAALLANGPSTAADVGNPMPNCVLSPLDKNTNTNLASYKGKVIYVDFWASWCGPCAKSFPFLNEMHQQLHDQGLEIVGVNLDENSDDAKGFLTNYPANFTVLADVSKQCAKDFTVKAMPSSYIIDRKGTIHHIHMGFRAGEAEEVRTLVENLLKETVAGL